MRYQSAFEKVFVVPRVRRYGGVIPLKGYVSSFCHLLPLVQAEVEKR
jgi:hypothetical protein